MSATPRVVFFDVGGVLASNGWDRHARRRAADRFDIDLEEFQDRHDFVSNSFETGELDLDAYLDRTIFYRDRPFGRAVVVEFMLEQTHPFEESLAIAAEVAAGGRFLLATLNNESRALNEHRIETLGLRDHFAMFLSSCYLGVRKPEPEIFRIAIDVTQSLPEECVFIDDRELNLECAALEGMHTIHFTDAATLRTDLTDIGVL